MTKAIRIFPTAVITLLLWHAAPKARAAEALAPTDALVQTASPLLPSALVSRALLPQDAAGLSLLPVHRTVEQMAADVRDESRSHVWRNRWLISLAPLVASQSLDAASSWGLRELNPVLAGPDGRFGMKATGIKFGVTGAFIGAEYLLVKKFPRSAKFFTVVNYSTAGITTGLAAHNYMLPGR